jgi:hypothetical protein
VVKIVKTHQKFAKICNFLQKTCRPFLCNILTKNLLELNALPLPSLKAFCSAQSFLLVFFLFDIVVRRVGFLVRHSFSGGGSPRGFIHQISVISEISD